MILLQIQQYLKHYQLRQIAIVPQPKIDRKKEITKKSSGQTMMTDSFKHCDISRFINDTHVVHQI